jgi:AcrR family transcriptional regulator
VPRSARREIVEMQRMRVLYAAIDAVEDVGYARMTVGEVLARSRVSRNTFYALFSDREQCFLAAFDYVLAQMRWLAEQSCDGQPSWRDGVRSALAALLDFIDEQPGMGRLCVVEALAGGDPVLQRRADVLREIEHAIDLGTAARQCDPPGLTAESVVGGVLAIVHRRLSQADPEPLKPLLGPLMYMIVLPYLGAAEAGKELQRADGPPRQARPAARPLRNDDPLKGLDMRLTYRTVRVLTVISDRPGASNREVAEYAEIIDQGQISKLLGRLERLALIENSGMGQSHGLANSWQLTRRGAAVVAATRPSRCLLA